MARKRAIKNTRYTVGYSGITQKYSVWDADASSQIASGVETEAEADKIADDLHRMDKMRDLLEAIASEPVNWNTLDHHYYARIVARWQMAAHEIIAPQHSLVSLRAKSATENSAF